MGTLLPNYRKNIVSNIINTITANNGTYYAFGSNPVSYSGNTPAVTKDDFSSEFTPTWQMLFGKKLSNTDVDRKSTRLNSSHIPLSRMPSSA